MPENKTIPKPEAPPKASVPQAPAAAPKPPESKNKPAAESKTPKELPKEAAPSPKPEAPAEPKKPEVKPPAIGPKPKTADEKAAKEAALAEPKKEPDLKVVLTAEELRSYFPDKLPTVSEAKRAIFDALDLRQKALDKQAKKQDIKAPAR